MRDILVIGAGPAGLTAAIYGKRAGMSILVLESTVYGGQLSSTAEVENYPSIQKISGWELAQNLYDQVVALGIEIKSEKAMKILNEESKKTVVTSSGEHEARSIIIANGARRRKVNCPGEESFIGKGVSYCATCDGAFFRNKQVAVIGGGNTALEDALFLSNLCKKVYLIHRRDEFRSEKYIENAVRSRTNIEFILSHTVTDISGDSRVNLIKLLNLKNNSSIQINVSGIFIAIGMEPDNKMFADIIDLDKTGYIRASENCNTNVKGIYAAGDTRTKTLRQIVTATADGAIAAVQASHMINSLY